MALVFVDALPKGQVLINTDQIVQANDHNGGVTIYLTDGNEVRVPHPNVHDLYDALIEGVAGTPGD